MKRRLVDVTVAAALLTLVSPLFVALLVVNRLWAGRWLFRQSRVGRNLRPFQVLKLQTMAAGSETGSTVTAAGHRRITPYGRFLRALKLDELPQLLNVVRGEMSLVGPRPLTPNEVAAIPRPQADIVYRVRPGLTGIGAVAFADEERLLRGHDDPERFYFERVLPCKAAMELAYARRRNWMTDLVIFLATPLAALVPAARRYLVAWLVPEVRISDLQTLDKSPVRAG